MVGPVSPGLEWGYPLLATTRGTGGSPAPAGSAGAGAGSRRSTSGGGEYPVYSDIRREYDCLEEDEELESFLTRVLDRRDQLDLLDREEEEQEEQRSAEEHSAPRWAATPPPVYLPAPAGQYSDACRVYLDTLWNIP